MALLQSELLRVKAELGYNVLGIGALPYVGYTALFDSVIAPYLTAGAQTTSSTAVVAASSPTPSTLTLASASGFAEGDIVIVDVDSRQERATIQRLSGTSATVLLSLAHTGSSYPVTVEGGEAMVRDMLRKLQALSGPGGKLESFAGTAGLKRAEDIEWYPNSSGGGSSQFADLKKLRAYWRDELASLLGVPNLWNYKGGAGCSEIY